LSRAQKLASNLLLSFLAILFVERSSTKPAIPPPPKKIGNDCKHLREHMLIRAQGMCEVTFLRTIAYFRQFYHFQVLLNHRANACSCSFFTSFTKSYLATHLLYYVLHLNWFCSLKLIFFIIFLLHLKYAHVALNSIVCSYNYSNFKSLCNRRIRAFVTICHDIDIVRKWTL
jgi:hypothetical protein